MDKNIWDILNLNKYFINISQKIVYYFRIQNFNNANRTMYYVIHNLDAWLDLLNSELDFFNKEYNLISIDEILKLFVELTKAQEGEDYVLLADLYELKFIQLLYQIQEYIIMQGADLQQNLPINQNRLLLKEKDKELFSLLKETKLSADGILSTCRIEITSVGARTIASDYKSGAIYLHSNANPMYEAFLMANTWKNNDKMNYIVYGLGLGYHIIELMELCNGANIEIYESNIEVLQLVYQYQNMNEIIKNNTKLYYDPDFIKLSKRLSDIDESTEFLVHYPSLSVIKDKKYESLIKDYFIQYNSVKNQIWILNHNFQENIKNYDDSVDKLREHLKGKDLYIVAAGPSLDKNYMKLKNIGRNGVILATGTVYRKLLKNDIIPDYVIFLDANERIYEQVKGVEHKDIPIIILSTVFEGFAKNCAGKKYIVCQYDYPKAEEFAKNHNYCLYQTGGSVSTAALDIGIQSECGRIIFLGLDLAYNDCYVHSEGTSRRKTDSTENLVEVEDIFGNKIFTTKILNIYRKWFERRLENEFNTKVIDATEGGAKIKGMKVMKLEDVIN